MNYNALFEMWERGDHEQVFDVLSNMEGIDACVCAVQLTLLIIDWDAANGNVGELPIFVEKLEERMHQDAIRRTERMLRRKDNMTLEQWERHKNRCKRGARPIEQDAQEYTELVLESMKARGINQ